jgi:Flp pilus assembly protein TadD
MRFEDAERLLQRSIWLDNTASGPYILMGKVLVHKKDYKLAERSLERALAMDPNNYVAHHLLGQTYRAQGRAEEAARELTRAQQLEAAQTHSAAEKQQP